MPKALLVVHQQHSDPGRIARLLRDRGYEIDLRRVGCGDPLPPTLEAHDAAVVFGGPMSANDCRLLPFIRAELDWLAVPLSENKPFLGICLGAQLLTRHLGGRVGPHPDGWHEIGYFPVRGTPAGRGRRPPPQERASGRRSRSATSPHGSRGDRSRRNAGRGTGRPAGPCDGPPCWSSAP